MVINHLLTGMILQVSEETAEEVLVVTPVTPITPVTPVTPVTPITPATPITPPPGAALRKHISKTHERRRVV